MTSHCCFADHCQHISDPSAYLCFHCLRFLLPVKGLGKNKQECINWQGPYYCLPQSQWSLLRFLSMFFSHILRQPYVTIEFTKVWKSTCSDLKGAAFIKILIIVNTMLAFIVNSQFWYVFGKTKSQGHSEANTQDFINKEIKQNNEEVVVIFPWKKS